MTKDPHTAAAEHAAFVLRLLKLTSTPVRDQAIRAVTTYGKDAAEPTIGRLALVGSSTKPRVGVITAVTPTKVTVSHFTDNAISEARRKGNGGHLIHLDGWPEEYRDDARRKYATDPIGRVLAIEQYVQNHYEWALKTQAVYRAVKHCPWVAFAPIRNTGVPRATLIMIPENGVNE